jgi:hypothetical protein
MLPLLVSNVSDQTPRGDDLVGIVVVEEKRHGSVVRSNV